MTQAHRDDLPVCQERAAPSPWLARALGAFERTVGTPQRVSQPSACAHLASSLALELTRMAMGSVLPGTALIPRPGAAKTEIHDTRELFFIVEHPEWHRLVKIDPHYAGAVRELVVAVNQAAREIGSKRNQLRTTLPHRQATVRPRSISFRSSGSSARQAYSPMASSKSRRPRILRNLSES
jgi:hypothetical protein